MIRMYGRCYKRVNAEWKKYTEKKKKKGNSKVDEEKGDRRRERKKTEKRENEIKRKAHTKIRQEDEVLGCHYNRFLAGIQGSEEPPGAKAFDGSAGPYSFLPSCRGRF